MYYRIVIECPKCKGRGFYPSAQQRLRKVQCVRRVFEGKTLVERGR